MVIRAVIRMKMGHTKERYLIQTGESGNAKRQEWRLKEYKSARQRTQPCAKARLRDNVYK